MKIKLSDEALAKLDDEFAWRRKELTVVWNDVKSAKPEKKLTRIRAATVMLYAHWEGFVKVASEIYISYVSGKRLKYTQLCDGLLAIALRAKLNELAGQNDIAAHIDFTTFLRSGLDSRVKVSLLGAVQTSSNLSSRRLKSIILALGLDYSPFELKENMIDAQLLNWRNIIAHGKCSCPTEDDLTLLYKEIPGLLRNFKNQVENAIVQEQYKTPNSVHGDINI